MAKKADEAGEFQLRPNRPRTGGKGEARAWSTALKTVLRYAGTSRRSKAKVSTGSARKKFNQRCAIRIMYSGNKTPGLWRAHGRYIARESAGRAPVVSSLFDGKGQVGLPGKALERWQDEGDPRLWKLIVSPEFGERVDLDLLTKDLMARMEKDLGTKLEWVSAAHFNTEHPHIHIALRGIRTNKTALELPRDYIRNGVRAIAEDLCTRQLGHRNELDAVAAERREIQERRFTSLDRIINRSNSSELMDQAPFPDRFIVHRAGAYPSRARDHHMNGRLIVLQQMGLAEQTGDREWLVRRDFETVLKAMQRTTDRQKMLASHGALLSDERLPLSVLDLRKLKMVEGRVLAHGEEELGTQAGRHYLLLEGTDARVHLIYYTAEMENARSRGQLRANNFIRLQKQFENGRPVLEVDDLGDAEKLLRDKRHLNEKARRLGKQESPFRDQIWGGWLGRYYAAIGNSVEDLSAAKKPRESERSR